jgi:tetratricopeptide (TPR) repeat protein
MTNVTILGLTPSYTASKRPNSPAGEPVSRAVFPSPVSPSADSGQGTIPDPNSKAMKQPLRANPPGNGTYDLSFGLRRALQLTYSDAVMRIICITTVIVGVIVPLHASSPAETACALLPLIGPSANPDASHWQHTIGALLESQLDRPEVLRVLPQGSVRFACRELKIDFGKGLKPADARRIGDVLSTRWVIWGDYAQLHEKWSLAVHLLDVENGHCVDDTASEAGLLLCIEGLSASLSRQMGFQPKVETSVRFPPPTSEHALELESQAYAVMTSGKSVDSAEKLLRQSQLTDPVFGPDMELLARVQLVQGHMEEAEATAKKAVTALPRYAAGHEVLGVVYFFQGLNHLALQEFKEAIRLDPDDPDAYIRASEAYSVESNFGEALSMLSQAERLAPYDPSLHAKLSATYSDLAQKDKALFQVRLAESYHDESDGDITVDQALGLAFEQLNEIPNAIAYYEKMISGVEATGVRSPMIESVRTHLTELRKRVDTQTVAGDPPRILSEDELSATLSQKLTQSERAVVTNPISSGPAMKKWASELAGGAKDDQKKAENLFAGLLIRRVAPWAEPAKRTAQQVFEAWNNENSSVNCQDYTFLYVALARSIGLRAFCVLVDKDYQGTAVSHACAGVFIGSKLYLVDPAYRWFGVPHKEYHLLNDLQTIGLYLVWSADLATAGVGVKLSANEPAANFWFASALVHSGDVLEARRQLDAGLKLDTNTWLADYTKTLVEAREQHRDLNASDWRLLQRLHPEYPDGRYYLATMLYREQKYKDAKDQYWLYLQNDSNARFANEARRGWLDADEALRRTGPSPQDRARATSNVHD